MRTRIYSESKLAQMMFAFELQDRLAAANKTDVKVYVCHPGSSRTSLITTSGNLMTRVMFRLQRALYAPTGRMESVGPVGRGTLHAHAYDKPVMTKLWGRTEKETGFEWTQ